VTSGHVAVTGSAVSEAQGSPQAIAFNTVRALVRKSEYASLWRSGGFTAACFISLLYYALSAADRSHPAILFSLLVVASLYAGMSGQTSIIVSSRKLREVVRALSEETDPLYLPAVQKAPDRSFGGGRFQKLCVVATMLESATANPDYYVPSADRYTLMTQLRALAASAETEEDARITNVLARAIAMYGDQVDLAEFRKCSSIESRNSIQREIRAQMGSLEPEWEQRLALLAPADQLLRASAASNSQLLIPAEASPTTVGAENLVRAADSPNAQHD
jgi:hypothetical protein